MDIICPPPLSDTLLFIDTSTSWGISFMFESKWLAWELIPGWKTNDHDIGWADMVAAELALHALVAVARKTFILFYIQITWVSWVH